MSKDVKQAARIVEFVGGSEDEIAYLRLLLRKAARNLTAPWRLRRDDDTQVDLLIVADLGGADGLPTGAAQRRVRLIHPAFGAAGMESALWPLSAEQWTGLANLASGGTTAEPPPAPPAPPTTQLVIEQNIYDELFESGPSERWQGAGVDMDAHALPDFHDQWIAPPRAPESELTLQAEQLFRREVEPAHKLALQALTLHPQAEIEATEGRTQIGAARMDRRDGIGAARRHSLTLEEANQEHPLANYLGTRLLPGPARIAIGEVLLTLDPRNRQFYAKAALTVLEDCCMRPLRRGDWKELSPGELAAIKSELAARAYAELLWLCHYCHGHDEGEALDANGRYRLIQHLELLPDYEPAARVVQAFQSGCSLTQAAAATRLSLAEVRRVVGACDAAGFLIPD